MLSRLVIFIPGPTHAVPDDVSARWYAANNSRAMLQIRYIDDQSIVVPGLSGQSSALLDNTQSKNLVQTLMHTY